MTPTLNADIVGYTKSCIDGLSSRGVEQVTSIIALVLLGIFGLSLVFKMLRGFIRGSRLQLRKTTQVLIAVVLTIFLTKLVTRLALNLISIETLEALLPKILGATEKTENYLNILRDLPLASFRYVLSVPVTIIASPFLFIFLYGIIKVIVSIIMAIIQPGSKKKLKAKGLLERFSGLCLASVEAILVFSVTFLPVTSLLGFADEVYNTVASSETLKNSENEVIENIEAAYDDYIEPVIIESPVLWMANNSVNSTITKNISTVSKTTDGTNPREEFIDVLNIAIVDFPEFAKIDIMNPTEEDKEFITALVDKLADNGIVTSVISGTVSTAATFIDSDKLGIKVDPPLDVVFDDILGIMKHCTEETLKEDLHLVKDVYFILADEHILANVTNSDALLEAMTRRGEDGKTAVQKVVDHIKSNERTAALVTTLTKLSITMLTEQLGNSEFEATVTYDNLKESMNEVLAVDRENYETEEEYKEVLTNTLDEKLKENNINIEKEIVENIADYVDENYSEKYENLTDEEFNDILLSYFDAYLEYQESGKIPEDLPEDFPDIDSVLPNNSEK